MTVARRAAVALLRGSGLCRVRVVLSALPVPLRVGSGSHRSLHSTPAAEVNVLRITRLSIARRGLSTSAAGGAGGAAGPGAGGAQGQSREQTAEEQQRAEEDESYYADDEPMASKISRNIWLGLQMLLGCGILGIVGFAGYTIVVTLIPSGVSPNAIMRKASEKLRADPELALYFGDSITVYGDTINGRHAEGRRYYVPDFSYTDKWDGQEYHRVRFSLEGSAGRKATVWAEVKKGTGEFRYIIVQTRDRARAWSIIDNRAPEPTLPERQARVSTLLADRQWGFFADNDVDVRAQGAVLQEYFSKVTCVRCDRDPARCEAAGVTLLPAWSDTTRTSQAAVGRGVQGLEALEALAADVSRPKTTWKWVVGLFGF